MIIIEKSFILVRENACQFVIDRELEVTLREEMRPILWFRMGMACVVPVEVLENALNFLDIKRGTPGGGYIEKINWKQAFPFPDGRAATILAGLDY